VPTNNDDNDNLIDQDQDQETQSTDGLTQDLLDTTLEDSKEDIEEEEEEETKSEEGKSSVECSRKSWASICEEDSDDEDEELKLDELSDEEDTNNNQSRPQPGRVVIEDLPSQVVALDSGDDGSSVEEPEERFRDFWKCGMCGKALENRNDVCDEHDPDGVIQYIPNERVRVIFHDDKKTTEFKEHQVEMLMEFDFENESDDDSVPSLVRGNPDDDDSEAELSVVWPIQRDETYEDSDELESVEEDSLPSLLPRQVTSDSEDEDESENGSLPPLEEMKKGYDEEDVPPFSSSTRIRQRQR
jgi:hypothetical protein